jgi:uncharacterized membrane protein YgdD (TMEM256/DUF423 family)
MRRYPLVIAGLAGASGVLLGALGAHSLADRLAGSAGIWDTAVSYHLVHAVAILGAALVHERHPHWPAQTAIIGFAAGIVLFSGSLYVLALGGPGWVGPLTPAGGLLLIGGWLALTRAALRGG